MIPVLGVPTLRRADLLARLLDSIDHPVEHLVIVDNGHQTITVGDVADHVTLTTTAGNLGVAGSWNLIIKSTPHAPWWLIVNDDASFTPGSLEQLAAAARTDAVVCAGCSPPWACFTIGERVIDKVGLFDERFHPAYCEDVDYALRCEAAGVPVVRTDIAVHHDNSSTIAVAGHDNGRTYNANVAWLEHKRDHGDTSEAWSLDRRRTLGWE